jgi:hypothetical protein
MAGIYAVLPDGWRGRRSRAAVAGPHFATLSLTLWQRALALGALVLSMIPIGLLFLSWHGLVPVGSDPSSCGLCAGRGSPEGLSASGLTPHTMELTLATIGLYGLVLFGPALLEWAREAFRAGDPGRLVSAGRGPLATAVAGALLLVAFPARPGNDGAGDLWKVAAHLPAIDGSSLLFWILVPLSGAVLWVRITRAPRPVLVLSLTGCFLLASLATHFPWQKYVDPFAVLILACTIRPNELRGRWRWAGALVLTLAFIAYTADSSSHRSVATPNGPSATVAAARATQYPLR